MLLLGFRPDISIICVLARLTRPCSTWSGRKNYSMLAAASLAFVCQRERSDSARICARYAFCMAPALKTGDSQERGFESRSLRHKYIRSYAFSRTAPRKSAPFGAAKATTYAIKISLAL